MTENRRTRSETRSDRPWPPTTVGTATRSRTPSAGMEAALLSSAADLLETEGPDSLSVRRIAAAANVAPMGVYNHFESKFGIVEALFIQGFQRLGVEMDAMAQIEDPTEALREGARRYRALALAHPMAYQVMFMRAVAGFEPSDRAVGRCTETFDSLVAAVQRAMERRRHHQSAADRDGAADLGHHPRLGLARAPGPRLRRGPGRRLRVALRGVVAGSPALADSPVVGRLRPLTADRAGPDSSAAPPMGTTSRRRPRGMGSCRSG